MAVSSHILSRWSTSKRYSYEYFRIITEEQREGFYRDARNHTRFMNTTELSEQCLIAQMFGKSCEEKDALLHGRSLRSR